MSENEKFDYTASPDAIEPQEIAPTATPKPPNNNSVKPTEPINSPPSEHANTLDAPSEKHLSSSRLSLTSEDVINVTFQNINYSVQAKEGKKMVEKKILHNVNGMFRAGKLTVSGYDLFRSF
jgi:hypothetical protein